MIKTFTLCLLNGTSYCNTCFVLNIFNFVFKWLVIRFVINNIFEVQMGSDKWFINTKSASQGIFTHDLLIISITLKHLLILLWIWSLKFSCWSSTNRKFFWKEQATTFVLLNVTESQLTLLAFLEKLFVGVWIKLHFPLRDPVAYRLQVLIRFTLLFVFIRNMWE